MVELGMIVMIFWPLQPEYHGCTGLLYKLEYIEELKETTTVLKKVECKDGSKYDYIVGIRKDYLRPAK
jgi:hypothetical protein